jgi:hypothetical protein
MIIVVVVPKCFKVDDDPGPRLFNESMKTLLFLLHISDPDISSASSGQFNDAFKISEQSVADNELSDRSRKRIPLSIEISVDVGIIGISSVCDSVLLKLFLSDLDDLLLVRGLSSSMMYSISVGFNAMLVIPNPSNPCIG